ncbi:MAG: MBL fold metallo-hydrolase, partial [Hyphomicrobiales bacterium]
MTALRRVSMAYNNVYVVDGSEGRVLIDTGPDYRGAREVLEAELADGLPEVVIATHGHHDHAGLGRWWQARGAPVAIGAADRASAMRPHLLDDGEFAAMRAYVEGTGAPAEVVAEAVAGLERRRSWTRLVATKPDYPPAGRVPRWPTGLRYEAFEAAQAVAGDTPVAGVEVWVCPGHTPGNLVVIEPNEGWLFSGDQLLPDITPTPGIQFVAVGEGYERFPSLPAFVRSLKRLQGRDFGRCFPGHGEPFDDVRGRIAANLGGIHARSERVLAELRTGGPGTVYGLGQ